MALLSDGARSHLAGATGTQSVLRLLSVPQTLCACFSSSGPAWTRYHTPLSPRSTRTAACAGWRARRRARLQARPGRLGDVLGLHRGDLDAPAAGRAGHALDQAGDARAAVATAGVVAGRRRGRRSARGRRRRGLRRRLRVRLDRRRRLGLGLGSLGAAGVGRPPAGSRGVATGGSSFSGWVGAAPGEMRLKTSLSWLGGTRPPAFSGFIARSASSAPGRPGAPAPCRRPGRPGCAPTRPPSRSSRWRRSRPSR